MRLSTVKSRARTPDGVVAFCAAIHPRLVGALAYQCGNIGVAEELAQEALARVWERWSTVHAMDSPEGWAFRVAFNLAASRFRRLAAEGRATARIGARLTGALTPPDAADAIAVRTAVASLPDRQRAAVVLRYFADLTVADTAIAMGCQPGTVRTLTSRAIASLRRRFDLVVPEEDHEHV